MDNQLSSNFFKNVVYELIKSFPANNSKDVYILNV